MSWFGILAGTACVLLAGIGYRRAFRATIGPAAARAMWIVSVALGVAWLVGGEYSVDQDTRVAGFPFPVVVLQRDARGLWLDYTGLLTLPAACLDFMIGTGLALLTTARALDLLTRAGCWQSTTPRA